VGSVTGRWVGIAGLVVCAASILGFVVAFGAPEAIRNDQRILDWYGDSTNQFRFLGAAMIGGLGGTALVVFVVGFRQMLAEAGAADLTAEVAYVSGIVLVAMVAVAGAIGSSVAATLVFSDTFELEPDTARIVLTIGNIWLPACAGVPGALFLGATALACRRTALLPRWVTWLGLGSTPLVFLAWPGFGVNTYLLLVWVLAASIVLLRRHPAGDVETARAAAHNP
jgi:hypothetical protein